MTDPDDAHRELPDWTREAVRFGRYEPSRRLIRSIRDYQKALNRKSIFGGLFRRVAVVRHRFWSIVCSSDIPLETRIGGGLLLPHPQGIVIHPNVRTGVNCLIMQNVTLGMRKGEGTPILGDHVDIGAGAVILGQVTLGNNSQVGANAVVLSDIPANCTAVGIPAKVIRKKATD